MPNAVMRAPAVPAQRGMRRYFRFRGTADASRRRMVRRFGITAPSAVPVARMLRRRYDVYIGPGKPAAVGPARPKVGQLWPRPQGGR